MSGKSSLIHYTRRLLLMVAVTLAASCTNTFPPNKIDPAGELSRKDYLALRERGESRDKKVDPAAPPPIPSLPETPPPPPPPKTTPLSHKLVSVSVTEDMPLREVLFELGQNGGLNLEIDPRITGGVIFTARQQPLTEVLDRLCSLAGLRYSIDGHFVRIELDEVYSNTYAVDYLNVARRTTSEVAIATNVFDTDVGNNSGNGGNTNSNGTNNGDNNSTAKIAVSSDADFWSELDKSLAKLLVTQSRNKQAGDKTSTEAASFSIDRQAGMVTVSGTSRQHETVRQYLERLQRKASAQVLIEARVVEVELSDGFQSGINWRTLFGGAVDAAARFGTTGASAPFVNPTTAADGLFTASFKDSDFAGILSLVRTFGTTRILSSPRLTVLNNQTAVLKVARNEVYFLTSAQFPTTVNTAGVPVSGTPVFSSTPRTVPVGLVMTVQPAINLDSERVTMTLRPTISRVVDRVDDPSIGLNASQAGNNNPVRSQIPVLAVREMDSVLQLKSGEVAVLGGLMQDSSENEEQGVPPFDTLPVVGNLAKSRDNKGTTSELVILLRATIMEQPRPDAADRELYRRYNHDPRPLK